MEKHNKTLRIINGDVLFLSFFGVGFFPKAPGTMGTLACLPLLFLLDLLGTPKLLFTPFIAITTILSCFLADYSQRKYKLHDPQWIVIDEVLGMSVAWLFIPLPGVLPLLAMAFLFRFFDILKFWPASYFDKHVRHGAGTILDDIVSGLYAALIFHLFFFLFQNFS